MSEEQQPRAPMSALAISMVKNEADIIEACVRHNLHFVDLFVVIDNGSTDGTRQILEALRKEGLPLLIFDDPVFGYFQSEKTTEVYRRVVPVFQPELVYLLDADEFIRAPDRLNLEDVLHQVPLGGQALLPWMTHIPDPQASLDQMLQDPLGGAPWRRRQEEPLYYKAVIRRRPEDDRVLIVEQGNHAIKMSDGRSVPTLLINGAFVAHLPVRTVDQVTVKAINGWHAYMVRNRSCHVPGQGSQWEQLYERVTRGGGLTRDDMAAVALNYAQSPKVGRSLNADAVRDPMTHRYGVLRYLSMGQHNPLVKVALSMEQHLGDEFRSAPQHADGEALDVAAVVYVLRSFMVRSLASDATRWLREVTRVAPDIRSAQMGAADGIVAPALQLTTIQSFLAHKDARAVRCIVAWMRPDYTGQDLNQILSACGQYGWEVDLMSTLSLRALGSYSAVRRGGLVMRPIDDMSRSDKAQAVKGALIAMAEQRFEWKEPMPQVVDYPLQTLQVAATA